MRYARQTAVRAFEFTPGVNQDRPVAPGTPLRLLHVNLDASGRYRQGFSRRHSMKLGVIVPQEWTHEYDGWEPAAA